MGIALLPDKADTPLVIDPNAVLPFSVACERLKPVAWRRSKVLELGDSIQLAQLPPGNTSERLEAATSEPLI